MLYGNIVSDLENFDQKFHYKNLTKFLKNKEYFTKTLTKEFGEIESVMTLVPISKN
jgi:hypothetical protein